MIEQSVALGLNFVGTVQDQPAVIQSLAPILKFAATENVASTKSIPGLPPYATSDW